MGAASCHVIERLFSTLTGLEAGDLPKASQLPKCRPQLPAGPGPILEENALKTSEEEGLLRASLSCPGAFANAPSVRVGDAGHGQVFSLKWVSVGVRFGCERAQQRPPNLPRSRKGRCTSRKV